ncbi:hypothetical protein GLE_4857 [Lysobacter enzymogenes]|uniref:Uncharacterized protein n=1 Tax=Lysobacter enzymogenes TaxID=69 RepID=A0A0S2DNI3_LYSEN|nr:hypothetical protein [Lysobacter enzymogenes]ALN60198.1 hypothetical protein GLE_4857 [Lysobacter enzymogenes]QCW28184.1 hypothetical protein FE772_23590 [Lysobacter enzymogenes]
MSNPAPAEVRRINRLYWIELILAWAGLCASIVWSSEYAETFQYSRDAAWMRWASHALLVALSLGCFAALQRWQPRLAPDRPLTGMNLILTMMVAIGLYALLDIVPIALHRGADPQPLTAVASADPRYSSWSRNCKRRVWIQGDTPLRGLRLCVRDRAMYEQLTASRRIEIAATASPYGIAIQSFRAAPAAQNP